MYTIDTNAIIYYLKNDQNAATVLKNVFLENAPVHVSTITEAELFGFSNLTLGEAEKIESILKTTAIITVD